MINDRNIFIADDPKSLAPAFVNLLEDAFAGLTENTPFNLLLSGGSTPRLIFEQLTKYYDQKVDWHRIRFFWGDERCVPPDDPESNYQMARKSLLNPLSIPSSNIFRIKGENDPEAESRRYETVIKEELKDKNTVLPFDLVMLGIGEDGHTVSLFPHNLPLFHSQRLFVPSEHPLTGQKRVSATGTLINQAKKAVFLVTGAAKAEIATQIYHRTGNWEKMPASYVKPLNGELYWLFDRPAASLLSQ